MKTFDVSGCTAQIVRPSTNLTAYGNSRKPFALCNASLYDFSTRVPVGTLVENGAYTHNAGNGYGVGTVDGNLAFGAPWDRVWDEYLTGYNSPVQGGRYVAPSHKDSYVFDCRLSRIGIGRTKDGRDVICVDDGVTIREFAMNAIGMGVHILVNLDGGGSRHLLYNGKLIYQSPRVPYNAIAFFKNSVPTNPKPTKCPYPEPQRNLILWSRGDDVKWLQWHLNERGFRSGVIDGIFGWNTWNALFAYQKTWSRFPDGICGPNTRGHINGKI